MTPQFIITTFEDNTDSKVPHYKVAGKISDDEFIYCPCISPNDFLRNKDKNKIPYLVAVDAKRTPFDERTNEFATGIKSATHPSPTVWLDPSLALMREQAKQSILVTAQRKLFEKHRFDYLDILGLILNLPINHNHNDTDACVLLDKIIHEGVANKVLTQEFYDDNLKYRVVTYSKNHLRLGGARLVIECDLTKNYFLISVLNSILNIRIEARIAVARYLQSIGESAKYFDPTRKAMITATAGVYDRHVIVKDYNHQRFIQDNDVILTHTLVTGENPASPLGEVIHVFESYNDAWIYAFKYAPETDIVVGFCSPPLT